MIALAVHGGAGPDSDFIRKNLDRLKSGLADALEQGYQILENGGTAIDAVQAVVTALEDNPLFNAGRGGSLNNSGSVEMDAAVMEGRERQAGAVSMISKGKNPVRLARYIMENTSHVLLGGEAAEMVAKDQKMPLQEPSYFVTEHALQEFREAQKEDNGSVLLHKRTHGTVGAVALDIHGNIAAATSTGGTANSLSGRIGDSCIIGAGCYADNNTCAVSATGDGEYLIRSVIAHSVASYVKHTDVSLQSACETVIAERIGGDAGVISVNTKGEFGIAFDAERMHRAFKSSRQPLLVATYID